MTSGRDHWRPAYVGIGSNLDDPASQVRKAFAALQRLPQSGFARCSPFYRSAPMGPSDQPDFVNAVAVILTKLGPHELLRELQAIEQAHGRRREARQWGPRIVDLDLLLMGQVVIEEPGLQIPHPGIAQRNFVLFPLADIAPGLLVPGIGSVQKLVAALGNTSPRIERMD
ncbi:MAG TPA: 2-amino-4-hydroxy-6-hydroxymethyldihydropteridine diphosphokinase [Woeseiaceae bacterium]|nr:2-amino-4-hydroxy-6-hydroxymethyldihydropteridine diphosphokinase [Woeseiaceae bacterium]